MKHLKIASAPKTLALADGGAWGQNWQRALPTTEPGSALHALAGAVASGRRLVGDWACSALDTLAAWAERDRTRRQLTDLDERALRDVGLTTADVWGESTKPFWRA